MEVWSFRPQMNIIESLEWLTDVIRCKTVEYRHSLRPLPRQGFSFRHIMDADEYGIARERARMVGGDPLYIPDWPNASEIPSISASTGTLPVDATYIPSYKVGGKLLIWETHSKCEVRTISGFGTGTISIDATTQGYTRPSIVPLRVGTFAQEFSGDRESADYTTARASFLITDTEDLAGYGIGVSYPSHFGISVVTEPVEIINGVQETFTREVESIDSKTGGVHKYPLFQTARQTSVLAWHLSNVSEVWARRLWVYSRHGRWKNFWTVSWNSDVVITRDISELDSTLEISAIGFAQTYPLPTDLFIVSTDGGGWFVRVTGATAGSTGKELLTLSAPFSGGVTAAHIAKTCRLTLSRFAADRVELQHLPGGAATLVIPTDEDPNVPVSVADVDFTFSAGQSEAGVDIFTRWENVAPNVWRGTDQFLTDGHTAARGERGFLFNVNAAADFKKWRGIYNLTAVPGSGIDYYELTRASDLNRASQFVDGFTFRCINGTVYGGSTFRHTTPGAPGSIALNSTALEFVEE